MSCSPPRNDRSTFISTTAARGVDANCIGKSEALFYRPPPTRILVGLSVVGDITRIDVFAYAL